MTVICTECGLVIDPESLCPHRNPVCWADCPDVHPWQPESDDPEAAA
jgi:hypothetical protein